MGARAHTHICVPMVLTLRNDTSESEAVYIFLLDFFCLVVFRITACLLHVVAQAQLCQPLCGPPWTVAHGSLSVEFLRTGAAGVVPFPSPRRSSSQGLNHTSPYPPHIAGGSSTTGSGCCGYYQIAYLFEGIYYACES